MSRKLSGLIQWGVLAAFVCPLLLTFCTNPTDKEPLKWKMKVEIPVTSQKKFVLGQMIDTLFFGGDQVTVNSYWDTTLNPSGTFVSRKWVTDTQMQITNAYTDSGKTVIFGVTRKSKQTFVTTEDSLADKTFQETIGPIPLGGLAITDSVPYVGNAPFSTVLPFTIPKVSYARFSQTSKTLDITLTNHSAGTVTNAQVGLVGADTSAGVTIGPGASSVAHLVVARAEITGTPQFFFAGTTSGVTPVADHLVMSFNMNGMTADSVNVMDSLINFSRIFTNAYKISDSVDMDYIDLTEGFFLYTVTNLSGMKLHVDATHRNLWTTSQCEIRNVRHLAELTTFANHTDTTLYYGGRIIGTDINPRVRWDFTRINVSGERIYPEWVTGTSGVDSCVTKVDYTVSSTATGATVGLGAGDSIIFIIKAAAFKFRQFEGTLMKTIHRPNPPKSTDTSFIPVELPFPKSVPDSLRDRLRLYMVNANVRIIPVVPDSAYIDSFQLHFKIYPKSNPDSVSEDSVLLRHVHKDTIYYRTIRITSVVNRFPDSVVVVPQLDIPHGTRLRIVNDLTTADPSYSTYIGRMNITADIEYKIDGNLDWDIGQIPAGPGDTAATLDLGVSKFKLDLAIIRKMTDRNGSMNLEVTNSSNVYMKLYGLLAPARLADSTFDSLNPNRVARIVESPDSARLNGYINLFGFNGVLIPARNRNVSVTNTIALDDASLDSVLYSDSCKIRWMAKFLPMTRDAMADTDWIKVNSWLHFEGVNNMDSLLAN